MEKDLQPLSFEDEFLKPLSFDDETPKEKKNKPIPDKEEDEDYSIKEITHKRNNSSASNLRFNEEEDDEDAEEDEDDFAPKTRKPEDIANKDSNFIFSFGTAASGKSVILSSMLYAMQTEFGILSPKIGVPNSKEAEILLSDFFLNMSEGVLPERTERDKVTRMDLVFKPNNKSKRINPIDLTFLESSGENWNEIRRGGEVHSSISPYLSANIDLTFLLVTPYQGLPSREGAIPKEYRREDAILRDFLFGLERRRHKLRRTNIILIISKWDKSGAEEVFSEEELTRFIQECLPGTYNFLETYGLARTFYTVGAIGYSKKDGTERIRALNLDPAKRLSKWLYKIITGYDLNYGGTFWERIRWSLRMK